MKQRSASNASSLSLCTGTQELDTIVYDYLAKIILLGPSGCGKSCLLHRFIRGEFKVAASQTIGVEFASKIVKVGQGLDQTRVKLQIWDTAGQERFRSLTRGYYRGSAGVILVYDLNNKESLNCLNEYMQDIRSLTSPTVSVLVLANKFDLNRSGLTGVADEDMEQFCTLNGDIPFVITSALTPTNVQEAFIKLAAMIVTKVELGVINVESVDSGVQYGEIPRWDSPLERGFKVKPRGTFCCT